MGTMEELAALAGLPGGGYRLDEKELTYAERKALPDSDFIFPENRSWPINDLAHGKTALLWARTGGPRSNGKPAVEPGSDKAKEIIKAVLKRYPELKKDDEERMGKKEEGMSWVDNIGARYGYLDESEVEEGKTWNREDRKAKGRGHGRGSRRGRDHRDERMESAHYDDADLHEEGEGVEGAIKGLKAGMHMLRERADYLWDILEKEQGFDVRRRMGRLIENIKHTEESVYGFIDTFDTKNHKSKKNMKP